MATYAPHLGLESNLIRGLKTADDGAFRQLYQEFRDRIYRTALNILREEESARDAVQETLINIHRAAASFRGEAKLSTWINRITVNVCLEILRKNKKHKACIEGDVSESVTLEDSRLRDPLQEATQSELAAHIQTALQRISRKHSVVVRMHDLEGYTIREISEILHVTEGTIKSRLFYGRKELKRYLCSEFNCLAPGTRPSLQISH